MKKRNLLYRIIVLALIVVVVLSIGVLADQSYYFDYKIKGNNVSLCRTPELYVYNNVLAIVQNNEEIRVYKWVDGIDNSYEWGYGLMYTGSNAGKTGYVSELYLTPNT